MASPSALVHLPESVDHVNKLETPPSRKCSWRWGWRRLRLLATACVLTCCVLAFYSVMARLQARDLTTMLYRAQRPTRHGESFFNASVQVLVAAKNRPDFIAYQYLALCAFLHDDFDFIVVNDAREEEDQTQIERMCQDLGITHILYPPEEHKGAADPSISNGECVDYGLRHLDPQRTALLLDSDVFMLAPVDLRSNMGPCDIAGNKQTRGPTDYLWVGFIIMDLPRLPPGVLDEISTLPGTIRGHNVDTGGLTALYLQKYLGTDVCWLPGCFPARADHPFFLDLYLMDNSPEAGRAVDLNSTCSSRYLGWHGEFWHYRAASNWNKMEPHYHERKTQLLTCILYDMTMDRETWEHDSLNCVRSFDFLQERARLLNCSNALNSI